jgi:hypothetical protein
MYWATNTVVLLLANKLAPNNLVLGNYKFGTTEAAIYAGFWMTFFLWTAWDWILAKGERLEGFWRILIFFWVINSLGVWLTSRLPQYTGFGISSYRWALTLGAVIDIAQRLVWRVIVNPKE